MRGRHAMVGITAVLAATATLLGPISAQAAADPHHLWSPPSTALPHTKSVPAHTAGRTAAPKPKHPVPGLYAPPAAAAQPAGTATVALAAATAAPAAGSTAAPVRAGHLPLWLARVRTNTAARTNSAPKAPVADSAEAGTVQATVADAAHAQAAGVHGILLTLARTDTAHPTTTTSVELGLDLSALDASYGADTAARTRLVTLPHCSLTTPLVHGCLNPTPVASHYDPTTKRLVADVTLTAGAPAAAPATGGRAAAMAVPAAAPMVLATQTTAAGGDGTYAATSLQNSANWTAGTSSGGFNYSYGIQTPPALGGAAPQVSLSYDSSSVDGRTSATNSQASAIGDGWDLNAGGFIERTYKSCDKDGITGSADECYDNENMSLSLAGHSGQLVRDDTSGTWHLADDDGTKVQFIASGLSGGQGGTYNEYAKVTDTSGMTYYFGLEHLPNGDGTDPSNNSAWRVPVYSPNSTDPCYDATAGKASWCRMQWRFNLSFVVDPHNNLISYSYTQAASNYYARGGGQNQGTGVRTSYTPGGLLKEIDYGQTLAGQVAAKGKAAAAASVLFHLAPEGRCDTTNAADPKTPYVCTGATLSSINAAHWPDVPYDQYCVSDTTKACAVYGPTFWTNQRLASITTQVTSAGAAKQVDSYALKQSFRQPNDGTKPPMWLDSIQRAGEDGAEIKLPAVTFTPVMMPNRVDGTTLVPAPPIFNRPRIQQVATETGESIVVDYNLPTCSRVNHVMPASPDNNTMACYSVLWYPPGSATGAAPTQDWFNHYTVKDITANDAVGGAPQRITKYSYGNAAWHRNDSELGDPKTRTWDQFRGFDSVTTTTGSGQDGPQGKTVTYYAQGMDGDYKADGTTRTGVTVGTGAPGGTVADSDWLAGEVIETDTYDHADATGNPGKVISYTSTRSSGPVTTATHSRGASLPALIARYKATNSTVTTKALLANGTWRTSATTTKTDSGHGNRTLTADTTADGLPESCTRTSYATSTNTMMSALADEQLTVSGSSACTATATSTNTVSDARTLYDGLAFGQAAGTADKTSAQVLDHYDTSANPVYTTTANTGYDSYGRPLTVTDPNTTDSAHPGGATTTMTYTPAAPGELPATVTTAPPAPGTAAARSTTETLDIARGLRLTDSDVNKNTSTATYDSLGRITAVWKPGHATSGDPDIAYTYAANGTSAPSSTTTATLGPKGTTRLYDIQIYNGFGQVAQVQQSPAVSAYAGRMISDTYYDSFGRTTETHGAWYNADSAPATTLVKPDEKLVPTETSTTYDGLSRPVTSTLSSLSQVQSRTTTAYPGTDETDVTPPAGATPTTRITDAAGRTTQLWQYRTPTATGHATDADVTSYSYTPDGKSAARTDSTTKDTWSYTYDLRGRQTSSADPDNGTSSTTYTSDGQIATATDARQQTLAFTYDLLGRKTGEYNGTITDANQLAAWTYDSTTITNGLGQAASSTRYTAGASGPAYTQTTLGYDSAYRSTGTTTTMPGSLVGQSGTLTYTAKALYDSYTGLPTATQDGAAAGQAAETLSYTYDVNGPLISYGSTNTTYDLATNYDPNGHAVRTTVNPWGTQVVATTTYDQATGRILSDFIDKQTSTTGSVDQYNYTYNQAGQLTSAQDIPDNTPASTDLQCFTYDTLSRLSTAWTDTGNTSTAPAPSIAGIGGCKNTTPTSGAAPGSTTVGGPAAYWTSYGYDPTGNRTTQVQHDPTGNTAKDITTNQAFPPAGQNNTPTTAPNTGGGTGGPHALTSTTSTGPGNPGSTAYQYDADGNTTALTATAGTTTFTWDPENHLAKAQATGTAGPTTYTYDASGNLLVQSNPTQTTVFLGADQITYKPASGAPAQDTRYYPLPNGLTLIRMGAAENIQASDPHGTASLNIDATTLQETRRYLDPFGNPRGTTPANWNPDNGQGDKGFVGGTQDPTTGLTNLGAREYQPTTGRFLNPDPLLATGDPQQWNGYAYSNNDPVDNSDPTGLMYQGSDGPPPNCGWGCGAGAPLPSTPPPSCGPAGCGSSTYYNDSDKNYYTYTDKNLNVSKYPPVTHNLVKTIALGTLSGVVNSFEKIGDIGDPACWFDSNNCAYSPNKTDEWAAGQGADTESGAYHYAAINGSAAVYLAIGGKYVKDDGDPFLPGCGANSFPGSVQVLTAGKSTKQIREVRIGDEALATNPLTGKTSAEKVTSVIKTPTDTDFTDLIIRTHAGSQKLTSTQHHPYWDIVTQRWTNAADLHHGDRLRSSDGTTIAVAAVRNYTSQIVTYNLSVSTIHTYYVLAGTTPILVHNSECDLFPNLEKDDPIHAMTPMPLDKLRGATGRFIYVVMPGGELRVTRLGGQYGHIDLAQGADVAAAGEFKMYDGSIKEINNKSGHYHPNGDGARNAAVDAFTDAGFSVGDNTYKERW